METPEKPIPLENDAPGATPAAASGGVVVAGIPEEATDAEGVSNGPPPLPPATDESVQKNVSAIPTLRTYKGDVAEAVQKKKETVSSIFSAEEARRGATGAVRSGAPLEESFLLGFRTKTSAFAALLGGCAFRVGGGLALFYFLGKDAEPLITPAARALIFVDKEVKIPVVGTLDKATVSRAAQELLTKKENVSFNDIVALSFVRERRIAETDETVEDVAPIDEILTAVTLRMPPGFPRSLGKDYLYGIHSVVENHPFLIVKTASYENTFGYLFQWGGFQVVADLAPLFGITRFPPPEVNDFTDILIKNRDVRVIYDSALVPLFYYSFVDRETLVFTTDRTTFDEILNRLATPERTG